MGHYQSTNKPYHEANQNTRGFKYGLHCPYSTRSPIHGHTTIFYSKPLTVTLSKDVQRNIRPGGLLRTIFRPYVPFLSGRAVLVCFFSLLYLFGSLLETPDNVSPGRSLLSHWVPPTDGRIGKL